MSRPTKIMHVTTSVGAGGAETMLANMLEQMAGPSFETVVVATMADVDATHAPQMRQHVDTFYDLNVSTFLRLQTLIRLGMIIRREKPDVVQTWMHKADLVGGIVARLVGVRNIVWGIHSRDVYASPGDSELKLGCFRRLLGVMAKIVPCRIVSCSRVAIKYHEQRFGYPEKKMVWIGNGVDVDQFTPNADAASGLRSRLGIPASAPVIGFVGRFDHVKDLPTFLRAATLLLRSRPDAHFVLCGDSVEPIDPEIQSALDEIEDKSHLHFLPFRSDIEDIYPAFTICSLTSKSEAYPMVLLEAMACGVPCVATDTGDSAAIVGDTGSIVPIGQPEKVAAEWSHLLELSPDAFSELGKRARERACHQFGLSKCVNQYETLYSELNHQ